MCSSSAACCAPSGWKFTLGVCSTSPRPCSTWTSVAREDVYHTCRALLVHRRDDLAMFDRAFASFWRIHGDGLQRAQRRPSEDPRSEDQRTATPRCRRDAWCGSRPVGTRVARQYAPDMERRGDHRATKTSRSSRPMRSRWRERRWIDSSGRRASAGRADGSAAAGRAWISGARSRRASAPAVTSSNCHDAGAGCGRARSSCYATSAARWIATPACSCTSRMR